MATGTKNLNRNNLLPLEGDVFFLPLRVRARGMLSFVQLLILQGGEQRLQFEATNPIIPQPPEKGIAARHFWVEANVAKRFAASDPVTDFVHNFFAADRWPTAAACCLDRHAM